MQGNTRYELSSFKLAQKTSKEDVSIKKAPFAISGEFRHAPSLPGII